ncbi:Lin1244/Lin1753 domain-containing protein [Enterococcus devriesei]|uniref:DnaD domain-containing protein n=1 Tax=Enterococcus devriesei TaxID=319970 RepID=A0A1L8SL46_9ENTE|nr:Lin1244/Lin1753 domain-containing protein [Enterococcus devriesei]OJG32698.1 DnaD domain-containing protein [Enterococcus devriesei]
MARPIKNGLDYFPLDVDIFEDEKIEAIAGEFGIKGELAVIKLLCAVYKKGYFVVWNDLTRATLLKRLPGVSKELLDQIVNRLVTWGFFDETLFNSAKVLTSENIQANYFEATKRRKSPKPTAYLINADINTQASEDNDDINTQSKVKETKVNKSNASESSNTKHSESSAVRYWLNQVNPVEAPFITQSVQYWVNDFGGQDEIVILAINDMLQHNARNYSYLEKILKSWEELGLDTPEKVNNHLAGKHRKNAHPQNKGRIESLPDHIAHPKTEADVSAEARKKLIELGVTPND